MLLNYVRVMFCFVIQLYSAIVPIGTKRKMVLSAEHSYTMQASSTLLHSKRKKERKNEKERERGRDDEDDEDDQTNAISSRHARLYGQSVESIR